MADVIDINLFAGAGGLALGLTMAGFEPSRYYEKDNHCCETLRKNLDSENPTLSGEVLEGDVSKVTWDSLDSDVRLLAAGAPCQPFSLGGNHRSDADDRNMFPEVLRAIRSLEPEIVILENVRGLVRQGFLPYFEYILRQLEAPSLSPSSGEIWTEHNARLLKNRTKPSFEHEYYVDWRMVNAADYGVPQLRHRVFIVATRKDIVPYRFPAFSHSRSALLESQATGEYWNAHELPIPDDTDRNSSQDASDSGLKPWRTVRDAIDGLGDPTDGTEGVANHGAIVGARTYPGHCGTRLDWPSKTIKAGVHGVPGGENTVVLDDGSVRYLTLRETARIQTFPDEHRFVGARIHVTKQIGNAVPCSLASVIARPALELLEMK